VSICNVIGSTVVRESEATILTHAGPEIGVASTKAFIAQVVAAFLLAVRLGRARGTLDLARGRELLEELRRCDRAWKPCSRRKTSSASARSRASTSTRRASSSSDAASTTRSPSKAR
jgi:glucosamine 6-phosphate synthetase-like amidotransferase/phosphosugar isomerase protein